METFYYDYPNTTDNSNAGMEVRTENELTEQSSSCFVRRDSITMHHWKRGRLWEQTIRLTILRMEFLDTSENSHQPLVRI